MKAPPPSKELCLMMAKITYPRDKKLSWTWLFAWGFHEMYVDCWYEDCIPITKEQALQIIKLLSAVES